MTIDEVTSWLRMSRTTFYRAVHSGELPAFKLGGVWRVDRDDVETLIERRKREATERAGISEGHQGVDQEPRGAT
jgi:excisionase family DNA binding protein